jgi:hypothetical protein
MTTPGFGERLQQFVQKVATSRFFMISVVIHVVIVLFFGTRELFNRLSEQPDMVAEGQLVAGDDAGGGGPPETSDAPPTPTFEVAPTMPTPPVETLSAIAAMTTNPTAFTMPVSTTSAPTLSTAMPSQPSTQATSANRLSGGPAGLPNAMAGRGANARGRTLAKMLGNPKTDEAVMAGLRWLAKNQNPDGSWGTEYRGAMTGLALLAFLGHGEIPAASPEFGVVVGNAINLMIEEATKSGSRLHFGDKFGTGGVRNGNVYEHGIATYALAEAYTMTKDERLAPIVTQAIKYIIEGQAPDGGWMYGFNKRMPSDTSVSGWQVQALKAAQLSQLPIEGIPEAMDNAMKNMERVFNPKDGRFGYRVPDDTDDHNKLTGVGVLCKLMWQGKTDRFVREGLKTILKWSDMTYADKNFTLYGYYYDTQACFMAQGPAWKKWSGVFQDQIMKNQSPDGSWPAVGGEEHGNMNADTLDAKVYRTSLAVLMLEVFYRYAPMTKEAVAGGGAPAEL